MMSLAQVFIVDSLLYMCSKVWIVKVSTFGVYIHCSCQYLG